MHSTMNWVTTSLLLLAILSGHTHADNDRADDEMANYLKTELGPRIEAWKNITKKVSLDLEIAKTSHTADFDEFYYNYHSDVEEKKNLFVSSDEFTVATCLNNTNEEVDSKRITVWTRLWEYFGPLWPISKRIEENIKDGERMKATSEELSRNEHLLSKENLRAINDFTEKIEEYQAQCSKLAKEATRLLEEYNNSARDALDEYKDFLKKKTIEFEMCVKDTDFNTIH